jgi:hypothetical protein
MPDAPKSPTSKADGKGRFLSFWTTLPGVLTGVAAVLSAAAGLAALWHSGGGGNGTPASDPAPATSQPGATTRADTTAPGILAHGRVSLNRGDSVDLEHGVIEVSGNTDVGFGPETTPTLHASATGFLAPIDNRPTKKDCAADLASRHDGTEILSDLTTDWVCVSTAEGHVAFVDVLAAPGVGNAKLTLEYAVWR